MGARLIAVLRRVHAAGLVHGDLTPCNAMYDPIVDRVVLLDFGHCSLNWRTARAGVFNIFNKLLLVVVLLARSKSCS